MTETSKSLWRKNAFKTILVGGLIAGILDIVLACSLEGWTIPLWIAAGLLGTHAAHGGIATYALGLLLHFFIAFSFAAFYYWMSRKLTFLIEHPLVSGLFYGIGIEIVMSCIVMPLSALHVWGRHSFHDLLLGLFGHVVMVGLPISYTTRQFAI